MVGGDSVAADVGGTPCDAAPPEPCLDSVELEGIRVFLCAGGGVRGSCAGAGEQAEVVPAFLTVWTDVPGMALFEWQVRASPSEPWHPPPQPWPPRSGVNGQALQTPLEPCQDRDGQELTVSLSGPWARLLRWQLFCIGPPMRRVPEEMRELSLEHVVGAAGGAEELLGLAADGRGDHRATLEESDSDQECGGCVIKLRMQDTAAESHRVVLARPTLGALAGEAASLAAALGASWEAVSHIDALDSEWEVVGSAAGFSMRLDSDAAVAVFLASAASSQLGAPLVELRRRAAVPALALAAAATPGLDG